MEVAQRLKTQRPEKGRWTEREVLALRLPFHVESTASATSSTRKRSSHIRTSKKDPDQDYRWKDRQCRSSAFSCSWYSVILFVQDLTDIDNFGIASAECSCYKIAIHQGIKYLKRREYFKTQSEWRFQFGFVFCWQVSYWTRWPFQSGRNMLYPTLRHNSITNLRVTW